MIKYLKNISEETFNVAGFVIQPNEIKVLNYLSQIKFFNSEDSSIEDEINQDKILISLDGVNVLSKSDSLIISKSIGSASESYFQNKLIRPNKLSSKNVQEAIEEVYLNNYLLPDGKIFTSQFSYHSTAKNKWLRINYAVPSNVVPLIIPYDCYLTTITFCNDNYADTDIEIHNMPKDCEDTNLQYLLQVRDSRSVIFNPIITDPNIFFGFGDKVGIYLKDRGTDAKKPNVNLHFIIKESKGNHTEQFYNDLMR